MYHKHHGSFGRRMLKKLLEREGIKYSEEKISNIMKECGLIAKYGRPKIKNLYTHKETSEKYIAKNIYNTITEEEKKKLKVWAIDFTEERIQNKKIYTCAIIEVETKVLVGYKQSKTCNSNLALETLEKAIKTYGKPDMITSDRGSQFTSKHFQVTLKEKGIVSSMSRPHTPVDNRFIETFFNSMKTEIGYTKNYNEEQYRKVVEYWIYYYNNERIHSSIGYITPIEYLIEKNMRH